MLEGEECEDLGEFRVVGHFRDFFTLWVLILGYWGWDF